MTNPTCAYCLEQIQTAKGSTTGLFFNKNTGTIAAYCLDRICAAEFREADVEKQKLISSLIERNLTIEGVSLDPNQRLFTDEGEITNAN